MKKNEIQLQIILKVLHSPSGTITENDFHSPNCSKAVFHRYVNELCEDPVHDGHPILCRIKENSSTRFALNKKAFKHYPPPQLESYFFISAYEKIGKMLSQDNFSGDVDSSGEIFHLNNKAKDTDRMFLNLSNIQGIDSSMVEMIQSLIVIALLNNKLINLKYKNKNYVGVEPLTLCQYRDGFYLIASKGPALSAIRKFKLSRIYQIEILDEKFNYPDIARWNPKEYFKATNEILDEELKTCTIRVYGKSRIQFKEKTFFDGEFLKSNRDFDEWELTYSGVNEFLGQLFEYAEDLEIVSPEHLKKSFIGKAESVISHSKKAA